MASTGSATGLRQAIRFAKEKVTLNINLSYTDTRGAMVN